MMVNVNYPKQSCEKIIPSLAMTFTTQKSQKIISERSKVV